jgi:hypothetical protein
MKKIFTLTLGFFLPYFVFVSYLALRGTEGIGRLPHWTWALAFFYFAASLVAIGYWGRDRKPNRTVADLRTNALSTSDPSRALKVGLVLYIVILLNGLRVILQRSVPLRYAVPGLIVDAFLIGVFWWLLARGRHRSAD